MFSWFRSVRRWPSRHSIHPSRRNFLRGEALEPRLALATIVGDGNWQAADGGVKDLNTGLVWSQSFAERTGSWWTYQGALSQANNLFEGGYDDWRLATPAELQEAAAHGILNHAYVPTNSLTAWSSAKCSPGGGQGHVLIELFDGSTRCFLDGSGLGAVAVRGTRIPASNSTPNVRVFSQLVYAGEGGSGRFTLALDTQPAANVTIPIASSDTGEGTVSVSQLVFTPTNWNVPQGVIVNAVDDIFFDPGASNQVILGQVSSADPAYAALNPPDVTVVNLDNETAILTSSALGADRVVSEDGSNTGYINIRLGGKPKSAAPVYVEVTSLDTTEGTVSPGLLVFNQDNWDAPQRVDVLGVADATADGDQTFSVQRAIGAGSPPEWMAVAPFQHTFKSIDIDGLLSTYSSANVNLAIPDPGTVTSQIVVTDTGTIGDLNVSLNISHTYDSDVTATLISPSGQRIELFSRIGGSGDNFTNTTFDDEGTTGISVASAPFAGAFRLEGSGTDPAYNPLGALDGQAVAGIWKLEVNDAVRRDKGTLLNWSLNVSRIPAPPPAAAATSDNDLALMLLLTDDQLTTTKRK